MNLQEYIQALEERLDKDGHLESAMEAYESAFNTIRPDVPDREFMAWKVVEDMFYPAPEPEPEIEVIYPDESEAVPGTTGRRDPPVGRMIPRSWGELPNKAPRHIEVEWVHQNWYRCRVRDTDGVFVLRMGRANVKAPSWGAVGLLEVAFANPQKFESDVYAREMKNAMDEDQEAIKQERIALAECRKIVSQMMEFKTDA